MSWLVAPRWTYPRISSGSAARRSTTSGTTGVACSAVRSPMEAVSKNSARHRAPMVVAARSGMRPTIAHAVASAASVSSIAWRRAWSSRQAFTARAVNDAPISTSYIEEDRLPVALQHDVEAVPVRRRLRNQRRTPVRVDGGEHRVTGVVLVVEVDPGD